ncbi:probable glutathione S-transferase [Macadamia integrifolia]|uniref:probable glutathione S-transferase n=1 Tax=Macadamia integrifolia TaxID=60698 RepID=UPI001C4EE258|nr:probable glutathione S-transferase [Macadamia integrifolia]
MAGNSDLKLLGAWFSPFVRRIEWALKLKGVEYEFLEQDLRNKSELLLQLNPVYKKVPVLVHNGKSIAESVVILQYIDETWKQNLLLPTDPYQRAMALFWAKFVEEKFTEVARKALLSTGEQQEEAAKQAAEALGILDKELKGKKFFKGESIGFLDIVLGWITIWLEVVEEVASIKIYDSHKFPFLNEWKGSFLELPIIKENKPPKEDLLVYFHNIRQFVLASAITN